VLVGILGTTISPYLFFWQAAQEVEEERAQGRNLAQRKGATDTELRKARVDIVTGMFASNAIVHFMILTTAATLHAHGTTHINTARQAAEALRPHCGGLRLARVPRKEAQQRAPLLHGSRRGDGRRTRN
jgi:Mn2+/Fe2+ NRAMP family transporter